MHVHCTCMTHTPLSRSPTPELLSEDMRRDRERREWEREAEEELEQDQPVGPVHYQELWAQEVRTHAAGYYAFSRDKEQRREQIGLLNKLRDQVCLNTMYIVCCVHDICWICTHVCQCALSGFSPG